MTQQFTASEVRDAITWKYGDKLTRISAMLRAFADLLEAREKAVPVAYAEFADNGCVRMWSRGYEERLPGTRMIPLYTHPSSADAERLTEALCNLVSEWVAIADDGDATLEDSTIGYRACANRLSAMLTANSAQAQPPAASVPDAMQELADKYHELLWAVARKFPGETRHETALRYIREAECQEAALAAQENPNG